MPPWANPSLTAAANAPASVGEAARHELDLLVGVLGAAVDRDDGREAELADDPEVADEVRDPGLDRREPLRQLGPSRVEPPWCLSARTVATSDDRVGGDAAGAADDVDELLHPHVGAEARTR